MSTYKISNRCSINDNFIWFKYVEVGDDALADVKKALIANIQLGMKGVQDYLDRFDDTGLATTMIRSNYAHDIKAVAWVERAKNLKELAHLEHPTMRTYLQAVEVDFIQSTPANRYKWILNYLKGDMSDCADAGLETMIATVNVLDEEFVDSYIETFNPAFMRTSFGAHKCKQLGRDLSAMFNKGALVRSVIGLGAEVPQGLPKWIHCYSIR